MRDYVSVLTIVIMTCIGLAVIIPMLCLCACLTRFCYVACQQKEPEKKKCSRRRYQVENREPKSGTSQHPVTDSTTVVNVSRNERQITKGQVCLSLLPQFTVIVGSIASRFLFSTNQNGDNHQSPNRAFGRTHYTSPTPPVPLDYRTAFHKRKSTDPPVSGNNMLSSVYRLVLLVVLANLSGVQDGGLRASVIYPAFIPE
ncbi:unnamed protein product [Acanthocheilonema viteae]|uniref:Uncharacterized protein n=1 Tax=Acanthocheilonema viteae TaxID=6277 RepID=A0A498S332_ACAVI|nr:unnamed protein product [Acanthocheilonema viteae]